MSTRATIPEADGAGQLTLGAAIGSWRLSLRAAYRSAATIKAYLDAAARFDAFLTANGMPRVVAAIRREHVEAWIVALQDAGPRLATVSLAYRSLQAF